MDEFFYHNTIKKYITAFGNMFNNIKVKSGNLPATVVPIRYASKEKFIEAWYSNDNKTPAVEQILPVMSYELTDISYDSTRKTNTLQEKLLKTSPTNVRRSLNPSPFDLTFTLRIYCRYGLHILQIAEQILPFFQPSFNITIKEHPEMGIEERDVSVVLSSVASDNTYTGAAEERRHLEWSMTFVMKAWLYPGYEDNFNIINRVLIDFGINPGEATISGLEYVTDPFGIDESTEHTVLNAVTYYEPFVGELGYPSPNLAVLGMANPDFGNVPSLTIIDNKLRLTDQEFADDVTAANYYTGYLGLNEYVEAEYSLPELPHPGAIYLAIRGTPSSVFALYALGLDSNNGSAAIFALNNVFDAMLVDVLPGGTFIDGDIIRFEAHRIIVNNESQDTIKIYKNNVNIYNVANAVPQDYIQNGTYGALTMAGHSGSVGMQHHGIKWVRFGSYE